MNLIAFWNNRCTLHITCFVVILLKMSRQFLPTDYEFTVLKCDETAIATSKTELDIWYKKLYIQVAHKLLNIAKILKLSCKLACKYSLVLSLPSRKIGVSDCLQENWNLPLHPRKLEPWFLLWSFFLLRLLYSFINLPYSLAWNTVAMSGLVPLVATWEFLISHKNRYIGLLVQHLLPLLNPWVILKM